MKKSIFAVLLLPSLVRGELVENPVEYAHEGAVMEGYRVYDDGVSGKRPAVLIVHQWTGLTDYEKGRARQLAEMGYNVFALDIYGKGIRPQPPAAAGGGSGGGEV